MEANFMKKQLAIIGLATLVVCVSLSGCTQTTDTMTLEKNKFVGTWKSSAPIIGNLSVITINQNGTWKSSALTYGTWDVKDGKFILNFAIASMGLSSKYSYTFSNSDKTLQVTGPLGGTFIYNKQ
jgi:hypothetical protein